MNYIALVIGVSVGVFAIIMISAILHNKFGRHGLYIGESARPLPLKTIFIVSVIAALVTAAILTYGIWFS